MSNVSIHKGTATIFHETGKPYTSISNEVVETIKNTDALAIWTFLQSKSNNWTVIGTFLMKHFNIGRKRYSDAMKCLKDLGLIEYEIHRDASGKISGNKIIVRYELPSKPSSTETDNPVNPQSGEPESRTKAPLPIKDLITNKKTNQDLLSSKPDIASKIIDYLNQKTGSKFRPVKSNTSLIKARIREGHDLETITAVIDRKCIEWLNDPKMSQYLRPATLFNAEKFNTYAGQLNSPLPTKQQTRPDHTSRHIGFDSKDYTNGLIEQEDGTYVF